MKFFCIIFVLIVTLCSPVYAAAPIYEAEEFLINNINERGVFNGKEGIFYVSLEQSEENVLFIAYYDGAQIGIEFLNAEDGIEVLDRKEFPLGGNNTYTLSIGNTDKETAVVFKTNNIEEIFVLRSDRLVKSYKKPDKLLTLAEYKNKKFVVKTSCDVYTFLKDLQDKKIEGSAFVNIADTFDDKDNLLKTISACADIISYDKNNFDIDKLMLRILMTHTNFKTFSKKEPFYYTGTNDIGEKRLSFVNEEYIDEICKKIFLINSPPKPYVSELTEKGYCTNNGLYYYGDLSDKRYHTEILDIKVVYNLGGGVYYTVFSDIYYKDKIKINEYSFAVIRKDGALLRIGMGETLLTDREILEYAPVNIRNNFFSSLPTVIRKNNTAFIILSIILTAVIITVYIIRKNKRKPHN